MTVADHVFHVDIFDNPTTATRCRVREGYGYCQIPRDQHPNHISAPAPVERRRHGGGWGTSDLGHGPVTKEASDVTAPSKPGQIAGGVAQRSSADTDSAPRWASTSVGPGSPASVTPPRPDTQTNEQALSG